MAGLDLYDWQQMVLDGALMLRGDDPASGWAAFEVGLVVGRQNGKGSVLEARQLAGLFLFDERLQVHTAHEFKTCFEHFRRVKELVESHPKLADQVRIIRTGAGDQAIELKNGNRIRFLARSRSSGRGFSADVVYLDEAFLLSDATIGALLPALSARPNPQIWYTSSAPHSDSEVLHRVRARGVAGEERRLFFAEWGNEADVDPVDRVAWCRANPSLGLRIDPDTIANEQLSMSPAEFARERLGVPDMPDGSSGPIPMNRWVELQDDGSKIVGPVRIALDVSPDRHAASFAAAGRRDDGLAHVEVIDRFVGTAGVLERAVALAAKWRCPITLDPASPAGAFVSLLSERGVEVDEVSTRELTQACGGLVDAVLNGQVRFVGEPGLTAAVGAARSRQVADAWAWSRSGSHVDITPLVAVTLALGRVPAARKPTVYVSVD